MRVKQQARSQARAGDNTIMIVEIIDTILILLFMLSLVWGWQP